MNLNKIESLCEIYIIIQQHPHFCSWSYDLSMDKVLQLNVSVHCSPRHDLPWLALC